MVGGFARAANGALQITDVGLAPPEILQGGFKRAVATGALVTTTSTVGAVIRGGLLRDASGHLVVVIV